jgi:hypothetical protein
MNATIDINETFIDRGNYDVNHNNGTNNGWNGLLVTNEGEEEVDEDADEEDGANTRS